MNDFTMFTVVNANSEGGDQVFFWNGDSKAYTFSSFNQNAQKRHMNSERNTVISFFDLRASNSGRQAVRLR